MGAIGGEHHCLARVTELVDRGALPTGAENRGIEFLGMFNADPPELEAILAQLEEGARYKVMPLGRIRRVNLWVMWKLKKS